jgi:hypothetical protein
MACIEGVVPSMGWYRIIMMGRGIPNVGVA